MKLYIESKEEATLNVFYKNGEFIDVEGVPLYNLVDWYPFSNAYEYKISNDKKYLELKRLRSTLPTSYGVKNNDKEGIKEDVRRCKIGNWYNLEVKEENLKIVDKAKKYGLPTITEPFDINIVEAGFRDLGVIFQSLKTIVVDRYLEGKTEEQLRLFYLKTEESQLNEALKESDFSVDITYSDLGQIYNMLLLMKKICKA